MREREIERERESANKTLFVTLQCHPCLKPFWGPWMQTMYNATVKNMPLSQWKLLRSLMMFLNH